MFTTLQAVSNVLVIATNRCFVSPLEQQQLNSYLDTSRWYTHRQAQH